MQQITGTYRRKKGAQKNYEYTATVSPAAGGFIWSATVRCDGELKGMPTGGLVSASAAEAEMRVRAMMEACIEGLDGVSE